MNNEMNELRSKKITLATLKAFAKKNSENLFAKVKGEFDGMTDCVQSNKGAKFFKTEVTKPDDHSYFRTGIRGIYTVGGSRDYFTFYEDEKFYGIEVYNCCGSSVLVTTK